jgi:hypothetical protein
MLLILIVFLGCSKSTDSNTLVGRWLADSVYNNVANPAQWFYLGDNPTDQRVVLNISSATFKLEDFKAMGYEIVNDSTLILIYNDSLQKRHEYRLINDRLTFYDPDAPELTIWKFIHAN